MCLKILQRLVESHFWLVGLLQILLLLNKLRCLLRLATLAQLDFLPMKRFRESSLMMTKRQYLHRQIGIKTFTTRQPRFSFCTNFDMFPFAETNSPGRESDGTLRSPHLLLPQTYSVQSQQIMIEEDTDSPPRTDAVPTSVIVSR